MKTCGYDLQQLIGCNENLVNWTTASKLQHAQTIKTPSMERFSPHSPQSSQYAISQPPVIVSFPALKIRNHVSFYPLLTWQPLTNDWTWILIPELFVKQAKSMQHVALLVCSQCLAVWEVLSHAQTTFLATTESAPTGTRAYSRANCPLLMGKPTAST